MAYQVGFDLSEYQNQPFLNRVIGHLPKLKEPEKKGTRTYIHTYIIKRYTAFTLTPCKMLRSV